jgi:hypothetical protein
VEQSGRNQLQRVSNRSAPKTLQDRKPLPPVDPFLFIRSSASNARACSGTALVLASVFGILSSPLERAPDVDDSFFPVDVAFLEGDPFRWP